VSPTYVVDVAAATEQMLARRIPIGLYHCVNDGAGSWHAIGLEVAGLSARDLALPRATRYADAKLRARRPMFCALSPAKLATAGVVMPTWKDAITRWLQATAS